MIKPTQKTTPAQAVKIENPEPAKPTEDAANSAVVESTTSAAKFGVTKEIADHAAALSDADLDSALKALRTEARRRDKEREASRPKVGSRVRILKGRPKYVGKEGTAVIVRKSRCFVTVSGINAPAYVLISDLELIER